MCVTSLLCGPQADLWPFYGFSCKRFSLYINVPQRRWGRRNVCRSQAISCLFFTFDETMSYWILCSLRSTSDKIIVPNTQLAIKWFTQKTKTRKTLFFFICYYPSSRQPAGKVQSFGPESWGYSEGGQIKTNFSLFCFVCICVCAKYFWPRETISPVVCLFVFFFKVWVSRFFCWCNVSQVLYIFHINC